MRKLFGLSKEQPPPPPPKPITKEELKQKQKDFKKSLNKEIREVDRQIFRTTYLSNSELDMLRKKAQENLRKELTKNSPDKFSAKVYAKQVAQNDKQKSRMLGQKAKIQNMQYGLDTYFSNLTMTSVMKESAQIMAQMNGIMNINEMAMTAAELQKEMMKMGIINEQIEDMMDTNDDLDDDDVEIEKIIDQEAKSINANKNVGHQMNFAAPEEQKQDFADLDARFNNLT